MGPRCRLITRSARSTHRRFSRRLSRRSRGERVGSELQLAHAAIPRDRAPNWVHAEWALDTIELRVLWDTGDFFDWEGWLLPIDAPNPPDPHGVFAAIRQAQYALDSDLVTISGAVAAGPGPALEVVITPAHRVYLTGGMSWGQDATELVTPMWNLAEAGLLRAAGFTHWIESGYPALEAAEP